MTIQALGSSAVVHRDPFTGQPGAHPIGTAVGGSGGATLGAIAGAFLAGPVGAVLGSVVGAFAGAGAGHLVGETLHPTVGKRAWKESTQRSARQNDPAFDSYDPAYRFGLAAAWETALDGGGFEAHEAELARRWQRRHRSLPWSEARDVVRDSWNRVRGSRTPGEMGSWYLPV